MKKSPKAFEISKPWIIIIIIIISGFLSVYFLGEGMISSVSTGYVSRPAGKERIWSAWMNWIMAKYQYYHLILKLTKWSLYQYWSYYDIVRLNWIRGAVRTSATIEWNIQLKEKPVSKIWNTYTETSYFTGADTLQPYKSCDAVWCTQHLKSCDVYITVLSIANSATSLKYMILLYKTIIFNWNFPWRV